MQCRSRSAGSGERSTCSSWLMPRTQRGLGDAKWYLDSCSLNRLNRWLSRLQVILATGLQAPFIPPIIAEVEGIIGAKHPWYVSTLQLSHSVLACREEAVGGDLSRSAASQAPNQCVTAAAGTRTRRWLFWELATQLGRRQWQSSPWRQVWLCLVGDH